MGKMIYLDKAATTKTAPEVVQAMLPYFSEYYGNPSSIYDFAGKSKEAVTKGRQQIADVLNAKKEEIDKITKEIKNYLNQSETLLQKKAILQNNQKEILTFLKKFVKIETCIIVCRNQKEQIEVQIRHYEELDHQEERKEELKEDCERAKKEADREQKNYENAWAEYEMKYHKFLNEQAGILALKLEDGQPCPVCGSREHPQIAALRD